MTSRSYKVIDVHDPEHQEMFTRWAGSHQVAITSAQRRLLRELASRRGRRRFKCHSEQDRGIPDCAGENVLQRRGANR
jgi:hypothetical protein